MNTTQRELTHPSWRRASERNESPRESLMSQMVRAQLIFDRRTPAVGMPAWRDADGEASPVRPATQPATWPGAHVDARLDDGPPSDTDDDESEDPPAVTIDGEPARFAEELAARLQLARDRVEVEHVHLTQVGTVADAYLGRPNLRLVK